MQKAWIQGFVNPAQMTLNSRKRLFHPNALGLFFEMDPREVDMMETSRIGWMEGLR